MEITNHALKVVNYQPKFELYQGEFFGVDFYDIPAKHRRINYKEQARRLYAIGQSIRSTRNGES